MKTHRFSWAGSEVVDSCLACYLNCSCGCGLCRAEDLGQSLLDLKMLVSKLNTSERISNPQKQLLPGYFWGHHTNFHGTLGKFPYLWWRLNFSFTFGWLTPPHLSRSSASGLSWSWQNNPCRQSLPRGSNQDTTDKSAGRRATRPREDVCICRCWEESEPLDSHEAIWHGRVAQKRHSGGRNGAEPKQCALFWHVT